METKTKVIHEKVTNKGGDAVYALGLVGSVFYFFQQAATIQDYLFGFLKALLWPAFLIYSLLGFLRV